MKEFKGTKQKWVGGVDRVYMDHEHGGFKVELCQARSNEGYISFEEMQANTNLIASAPELLEALQSLQAQFKEMILDEGIDPDEGDTQAFNQANKAINKALNGE